MLRLYVLLLLLTLRRPASKSPMVSNRKWKKKVLLFEPKASFNTFPFFVVQQWEPEGRFSAVAFFGLPFLAKQKR